MAAKPTFDDLRRSLGGYKAHLTRTCDSNEHLIDLAATIGPIATDGLHNGLVLLDERVAKCDAQIDLMLSVCAPKDFEAVEALREPIYKQYNKNRREILECLAQVAQDFAAGAVAGAGAGGAAGGGAAPARLTINKSLKPFTLLPSHTPADFRHWKKLYKAYFRTSHMEVLDPEDQQVYLQSCVDPSVWGRIHMLVKDDTPAFDDGFRRSLMAMLQEDLLDRYPVFTRRLAFFRCDQQTGEDTTTWVGRLEELSVEAEITNITADEVLTVSYTHLTLPTTPYV